MKKPVILRAPIINRMWQCGAPNTDTRFAEVAVAAQRAGCTEEQAFLLAMLAYDTSRGYLQNIERDSRQLRSATLEHLAATNPRSIWAYARHKLGTAYRYCTSKDIDDIHREDHAGWSAWSKSLDTLSQQAQEALRTY